MKSLVPKPGMLLTITVLLALLAGCSGLADLPALEPIQTPPNPALFPRNPIAPATRVAGRVALVLPPQVAATMSQHAKHRFNVQLAIGRIVEQAAILVLGDAVSGGVDSLDAAPAAGTGYIATLVIDTVGCVERFTALNRVLGEYETAVQVTLGLRLLDAQGKTVWTQDYDSGFQVWKPPVKFTVFEFREGGIVRLAHEGAWRLMEQAVVDLRDWAAAERRKAREL